jgi:NTE family protein
MRRGVAVVLLLGMACAGQAQEPAKSDAPRKARTRPKICVALEGGGALGLAHIGVLEWLEENHIPVDCIAGTSMGGLIGGFYAAGATPGQIRELVAKQDWGSILSSATPYADLAFRRKEDQRAYPNAFVLGLRDRVSLPAGLSAGQQISLLIEKQTLGYSNVKDFDELPIPFRSVATDLVSGKQVTFRGGALSLSEALRATMSIPGVYSPVQAGEQVYVDGGLVDNLPTDAVREMGAEIVIAVHLKTRTPRAKDIQSIVEVLGSSVDTVVAENELRGLAGADLVITVDLSAFDSAEYEKNALIVAKGREAGREKAQVLAPYALGDAEWAEYLREREARKIQNVPVPQFVEVQGTSATAAKQIGQRLAKFAGQPIDTQKIGDELTRLTGSGRLDRAGYRLTKRDGRDGLLVELHEPGYAPPTIQPGLELDGSESGDVNFTLGARLTFLDTGGYGSEWRTDFVIGSQYGVRTEYFHPFTAGSKWFVAPEAGASNSVFKIYGKNDPLAEYRVNRASAAADVGYSFNRFTELRAGYEVGYWSDKLRIGSALLADLNGRQSGARLRYVTDWTDDPIIPRRGVRIESSFHWYDTSPGAAGAFPALEARVGYFQPVTRTGSVFLISSGGTTFGEQQTGLPQFFLGGPERLGAYGLNELRGNQYFLFQGGYLHDLMNLPTFVGKKIYFTAQYEVGKMYGAGNVGEGLSRVPNDVSAGVLAETAFGPIFLGGSVGDSGHRKWFFRLGRVF